VLLFGAWGLAAAPALADSVGDVHVFAQVGSPGFPALPHVIGGDVFEGTYDDPTGDSDRSKVFEYGPTGTLLKTWVVQGQDTSKPHGVQVATNDSRGRLVLLDKTSGRILLLDPPTGSQTLYSTIPDLPTCNSTHAAQPCSQAVLDLAPMPDYAAWGPDGSLYLTDYQQAVIWKIPPGGGKPTIWISDRRLDGGPFGTACVVLMPDHHTLLFDQASNGGLGGPSPTDGKLYSVPIEPDGAAGPMKQLWESGPADAPDGCALASNGDVFVAEVGFSNQIVELDGSGKQLALFGQAYTGTNSSAVPFDSPSGLAFFGTDLLIANQSYFANDAANQAILAMQTGVTGAPVYVPAGAGVKPAPAGSHKKKKKKKKHKHKPKEKRHKKHKAHKAHAKHSKR
jgi:hypothetical protein